MTRASIELPTDPAAPDLILLALCQSRLRERSLYLGEVVRSQRRRLPASRSSRNDDGPSEADLAGVRLAEQALAAVQKAQERIGLGRYGLCDECQSAIDWDELLESPEQSTCRNCGR